MRYLRILALTVTTLLGISSWAVAQDWAGTQRDRDVNRDSSSNSPAFRQGKQQGERDALRKRRPNWRSTRWNDERGRRDYEMGYKIGYREASYAASYGSDQTSGRNDNRGNNERENGYSDRGNGSGSGSGSGYADRGSGYSNSADGRNSVASGSLTIQPNNIINWQTNAANARVYVVKDNKPEQVFAEGRTGSQGAPWIEQGHQFVFILREINGNELARQQLDLRSSSNQNQRGNR